MADSDNFLTYTLHNWTAPYISLQKHSYELLGKMNRIPIEQVQTDFPQKTLAAEAYRKF